MASTVIKCCLIIIIFNQETFSFHNDFQKGPDIANDEDLQ